MPVRARPEALHIQIRILRREQAHLSFMRQARQQGELHKKGGRHGREEAEEGKEETKEGKESLVKPCVVVTMLTRWGAYPR
jgi:hypothetical protein